MSTRGSVAWRVGRGIRGVYNHCDSYPTYLGREVWNEAKSRGVNELIAALKGFGDWREFKSNGQCRFCGKQTGQPHSYSMLIDMEITKETILERATERRQQAKGDPLLLEKYREEIRRMKAVYRNIQRTGFPDPDVKLHEHGQGKKDQFDPMDDPLAMQWVYLIDAKGEAIRVYKSVEEGRRNPALEWSCKTSDMYTHVLTGIWNLTEEPDFKLLEEAYDVLALDKRYWAERLQTVPEEMRDNVCRWLGDRNKRNNPAQEETGMRRIGRSMQTLEGNGGVLEILPAGALRGGRNLNIGQ